MSEPTVEINSQINELYSKTKVTQRLKNETENPLELQIKTLIVYFHHFLQK